MTDLAQHTPEVRSAAELVAQIEASVISGELLPGQRLPSVRRLATQVGLSPVTVAAGLAELRRRGLVITEQRRGSRIGEGPPVGARRSMLPVPPGVRDLSRGNPDPALLPDLAAAIRRLQLPRRLYGEPALLPALGEVAAERLRADGVASEHLCVASGALDAIERVLAANLRPGDVVAVEDPGYVALYDLLRAGSMRLEPVAIDDHGMLPDGLAGALARGAGAVILTPRAQNPTGAASDDARARELRALLRAHPQVLVVEDDHLGPLAAAPLNSVAPGRERWAFTRSVSKALGPDLRLAVLAGDERTIARVQGRQQCGPGWVSHVLQALVAELWSDADVEQTVERAAESYVARRRRLLGELARHGIAAHGASGLNVWIPVPEEAGVLAALLQRGFLVAAGAPYRLANTDPSIRVTVSTLLEPEAAELAGALAETLCAAGASRSG